MFPVPSRPSLTPTFLVFVIINFIAFLRSLTVNPDLAISVFVCGFEECSCLVVSQISALLGKALQYIPEERTMCCREASL